MANWFRPAPRPQQFVGTAIVGLSLTGFVLKSLIVAVPLAFVVGYVAKWYGESTGYNKGWNAHGIEIARNTKKKNDDIAETNSIVDRVAELAERENEIAAAKAITTLEGFPFKQRQECALKCSIPKNARANLEAIR